MTGADGSIGTAVVAALEERGDVVFPTDIEDLDVRDLDSVRNWVGVTEPDVIVHLAGAKHAPEGEDDPYGVCVTNTVGTRNVLAAGPKVVLASTCKAADPETAYGASKLLAERMTLNAGGSVARFFNVPESSGNVFELWRSLPDDVAIPVTPCTRYFQSLEQAVGLLLATIALPAGRYCVDPGLPRRMAEVAAELYPDRPQREIAPRRGDRLAEPLCASHERLSGAGTCYRVTSPHDQILTREAVAA